VKKSCFLIVCCAFLLIIAPLTFAQWGDPPGGWDGWYSDWADLADWNHDNGSDQWDETPPGVGALGGVIVETVDGEEVLSIEDAGDPRDAGFPDPGSNRKIYFQQEATSAGNIFEDGVTFIARWRINPNPLEAPANGNDLHDGGKGHVGIAHDSEIAGDTTDYNMSFALDTGGLLYFANEDQAPLEVGDEFQFHAVWATAVLAGDLASINVYLDGATDPAFSGDVTLGDGTDGNFANYVAVGMGSTGRDGAIQVDFIGFKSGIYEPAVGAAVTPADRLPSMWGEMKMAL
jgi:hypothetical protein